MNTDEYTEALHIMRAKGGDMEIASVVKLLRTARRKGDFWASYALGTWYFHGEHFKTDKAKGFALMLEAADNFVPDACYDVAVSYELGDGVRKSRKSAVVYYLRAMMLGEKQSVTEVGRVFYWGIGVQRNRAIAKELLNFQDGNTATNKRKK